jgi:acyl carrier protein
MTEDEIYQAFNDIFRDVLDDPSLMIEAKTTAADIPEWDSFSHINLVVAIELHFGVKFGSYEIERLENVGDMVALTLSKIQAK